MLIVIINLFYMMPPNIAIKKGLTRIYTMYVRVKIAALKWDLYITIQ